MKEWKKVKLGEYIITNPNNINKDYSFSTIFYLDTGSITSNQISELQLMPLDKSPSRAKRLVKDGDIIYSTVRPNQLHYGYLKNTPKNLVVSTGFIVIRTLDLINSKFLYYYLIQASLTKYLHSIAEGSVSTYPSIKPNDIEDLKISLPPLKEQKAIAEVLSNLDDKIELLQKQNETLEQLAETLFRQWFIEEAEEDWEEKTLIDIAEYLNGLACQKFPPQNNIEKLPVLKIRELKEGFTDKSDWATSKVDDKYIIEAGDVIFSWSASLIVKIWEGQRCILNQHLFKVSSVSYPKWYYYLWTKYHLNKFISIAEAHATTMGHIKRSDLSEAKVLVPTTEEIVKMTSIIEPYIDKVMSNSFQIQTLTEMRDTLLPKLMSGEARVKLAD